MKQKLLNLIQWLKAANLPEETEEVEDLSEYAEPWHEEAVKEFPEIPPEPVTEDYLEKVHPIQSEELKTKFYTDPEEEALRRDQVFEIARDENFKILDIGSKDIIAGQGAYGVVLRGVYRGKPAVAKIILGNEGRFEVQNWKTILEAARQIPKIRPHVPKIYKLNYEADPETAYGIVIMEELRPLNQQFREIIRGGGMLDLSIMKDEDYLWKFAQDLAEFLSNQDGISIDPTILFKWIYQIDFASLQDTMGTDETLEVIGNYLETKLNQTGNHVYLSYLLEFLYSKLVHAYFPSSYSGKKSLDLFQQVPETAGYANALVTLLDDFGLGWDDVRGCNMMLGTDGNLKIIDPGIYQRISSRN